MKIQIRNVRLAFPDLFIPKAFSDDVQPMYRARFILPKDHKDIKSFENLIEQVGQNKWGAKWVTQRKALAGDKWPLRDGDLKANITGFEGNYYINSSSRSRPLVINRDRTPITEDDHIIYGGCYVIALLDMWAQDNSFGKRINCTLSGVQFYADGDSFLPQAAAKPDDFEDLSDVI